jgi:ABC-type Na+ efflux pump permease subunit
MLFSKFTSSEQSYAAALRQDTQHQQPQVPQTYGKSVQHPVQQHLLQQEYQKTGLSVQAPSLSDNDKLKVATVVRQIMRELSEAVPEEDSVMIVTMLVLDLMQQNGC